MNETNEPKIDEIQQRVQRNHARLRSVIPLIDADKGIDDRDGFVRWGAQLTLESVADDLNTISNLLDRLTPAN